MEAVTEKNSVRGEREQITLEINGMTCANCVQSVEDALASLPGVTEARVNLAVEKAYVQYDGDEVTWEEMIKAVEDAGYEARRIESRVEKVTLKISGMTCANCAQRIGAIAMFSSSINVVLNSTRLRKINIEPDYAQTDEPEPAAETT